MSLPGEPGYIEKLMAELQSQPVPDYFQQALNGFFAKHSEFIVHGEEDGMSVRSVSLVSPPAETQGRIGYHVVYGVHEPQAEDLAVTGLVVANPRIVGRHGHPYDRAGSSRHYILPRGVRWLRRRDKFNGLTLASNLLEGPVMTRKPIIDPYEQMVEQFKEDVFTIAQATPLTPVSNRVGQIADLSDNGVR